LIVKSGLLKSGRDTDLFSLEMATGLRSALRRPRHHAVPVAGWNELPPKPVYGWKIGSLWMKTLFLALLAYTGYRLAVGIRQENAAEPLLLRDQRAGGMVRRRKSASRG
jgi:hypothetical protein